MFERASGHKVTKPKDPEAAKALAKFLSSEAAVSVMKQKGMDPG
jgi:ABC-type molybdate transport system substrate-binding protein